MLSVDRIDNNYLTPKGSSNNLLFQQAKKDESSRQYGNYLDIDDIMQSPARNQILSSPVLSIRQDYNDLSNYGEIEEVDDERRLAKKRGTNYDYRTYQKTDLIKKNLIPAFEINRQNFKNGLQELREVDEKSHDSENPNINESLTLQPETHINQSRTTNSLAPRFQFSKVQTQEINDTPGSGMMQRHTAMKKNQELIDLNDSDDDQEKQEENEEEMDIRRIHTKQLINHNLSIQKKANAIYKNLQQAQSSAIKGTNTLIQNRTENIILTEEDSQKPLGKLSYDKENTSEEKVIELKPQFSQQQFFSQTQMPSQKNLFSNTDLISPEQYMSNMENELLDKKQYSHLKQNQLEPQYLSLQKQETEINMSKEIQEIIKKKAVTQKEGQELQNLQNTNGNQ